MRVFLPFVVAVMLVAASCGGDGDAVPPAASQEPQGSTSATTTEVTGTTTDPFASFPTTTFPDLVPPPLSITDPFPNAQLDQAEYVFTGRTEPGATVVANGSLQETASQEGLWSLSITLTEGANTVTFLASDAAGNTTEQQITVFYTPKPDGPCGRLPTTLLPPAIDDVSEAIGDLDGDGNPDTTTVYRLDEWHIHVQLAYGWGVDVALTPYIGSALPPAEAVAVVDIGAPVIAVLLGASALGASYAMFAVDECALRVAELATGEIPPLLRSDGDDRSSWFVCRRRGIIQFDAVVAADDAGTIIVRESDYDYEPSAVRWVLAADADATVAGDLAAVVARLQASNPPCFP